MKILIDTHKVNVKYLSDVIAKIQNDEIVKGRLTQITVNVSGRTILYNCWHNKDSITISSQEIEN